MLRLTSPPLGWTCLVGDKFNHWEIQRWPSHLKLGVIYAILVMVLYFLSLLSSSRNTIDKTRNIPHFFVMEKEGQIGQAWITWQKLCNPKETRQGGDL